MPGVCRVAECCRVPGLPGLLPGLLPGAAGCCRVLPGAARLRQCGGTSRCCRVLPGAAGLPGCRAAGLPVGCQVGLSGLLPGLCSGCQVGDSAKQ